MKAQQQQESEPTLPKVGQVKGPVIVIEFCQGCRTHSWNTRHDAGKYVSQAAGVAAAITAQTGVKCLFNQVPKGWHHLDFYNQLIGNEDDSIDVYDMMPRIGALEITVCYTQEVRTKANDERYTCYDISANEAATGGLLLYSKLMVSMWPHFGGVADRIRRFLEAVKDYNESEVNHAADWSSFEFNPQSCKAQKRTTASNFNQRAQSLASQAAVTQGVRQDSQPTPVKEEQKQENAAEQEEQQQPMGVFEAVKQEVQDQIAPEQKEAQQEKPKEQPAAQEEPKKVEDAKVDQSMQQEEKPAESQPEPKKETAEQNPAAEKVQAQDATVAQAQEKKEEAPKAEEKKEDAALAKPAEQKAA